MAKQKQNEIAIDPWADPKKLGVSDRVFFKPEAGTTRRIKLMAPPTRAHVQYVDGLGFIHTFCEYEDRKGTLVLKEQGIDMELLGKEPQLLWLVPVVVYDTDKKGQIGSKKAENVEYEIQLWSFYANDYKRLHAMVIEWGIDEFDEKDLLITGTKKGRYINIDIAIAAKKALCLQPGLQEKVDAEFAGYKYRDGEKSIARRVTEAEFEEAVNKLSKDDSQGSARKATK